MSIVNTETGELVEFDPSAAERRAERITLRLDAIADNYRAVLPMIREAIEKRDDLALGYRSPGDYVSDRFGQSLAGLGIEVRRAVVGELTAAGLSTRAIAPVVGVSNYTVNEDQRAVRSLTPHTPPLVAPNATAGDRAPAVVGVDGKTYTRPPLPTVAEAVAEFPDLAYYAETGRASDVPLMATDLRRYHARGELAERLDTLRRSIDLDKSKRDGTYEPTAPHAAQACPTCGQTLRN